MRMRGVARPLKRGGNAGGLYTAALLGHPVPLFFLTVRENVDVSKSSKRSQKEETEFERGSRKAPGRQVSFREHWRFAAARTLASPPASAL